jgi:hypothetical protein
MTNMFENVYVHCTVHTRRGVLDCGNLPPHYLTCTVEVRAVLHSADQEEACMKPDRDE